MPPPPLEEHSDLLRTAEIGVGLHVDFSSRDGEAAAGAGEEPGHALANGGGDALVEIRVRVFEGEKVWPGKVGDDEEVELREEVEEGGGQVV